jgi:hypothetical protein
MVLSIALGFHQAVNHMHQDPKMERFGYGEPSMTRPELPIQMELQAMQVPHL